MWFSVFGDAVDQCVTPVGTGSSDFTISRGISTKASRQSFFIVFQLRTLSGYSDPRQDSSPDFSPVGNCGCGVGERSLFSPRGAGVGAAFGLSGAVQVQGSDGALVAL